MINESPSVVLQLGDPRLRRLSEPVVDVLDDRVQQVAATLKATLDDFRARNGFGRAIAAPQIGVGWRMIAYNLGQGTSVMINPEITWRSEATFTMWDDCMCFPTLLVRVQRHRSISVRFLDEQGEQQTWLELDQPTAELLQHEIDHLDGVLAVDHALGADAIISREAFLDRKDFFAKQVDYVIG